MRTAKARKFDQLYVSKSEFSKYEGVSEIKKVGAGLVAVFDHTYRGMFGLLAFKRLKNSASRVGRSTLGYFIDVLSQ